MIESILIKNWRTILLVMVMLFAWFVWPTPYRECPPDKFEEKPILIRENRFTGTFEWRFRNGTQWEKAKE